MGRMEDLTMVLKAEASELGIGKAAKSVLCTMAAYANQDGVCWPSRAQLADAGGWGVRAISGAVAELYEAGLIERWSDGRRQLFRVSYDAIRARGAHQRCATRTSEAHEAHTRGAPDARHPRTTCAAPAHSVHRNKEEQTIEQTIEQTTQEGARDLNPHDALVELQAAYPSERQAKPGFHRQALIRAADRWRDDGEPEPYRRIVEAAREYAVSPAARRGRFTPALHSWLDGDEHRASRDAWYDGASERDDKAEREARMSTTLERVSQIARMSDAERAPLVERAIARWPHLHGAVEADPNSNERRSLYAACAKIEQEAAA